MNENGYGLRFGALTTLLTTHQTDIGGIAPLDGLALIFAYWEIEEKIRPAGRHGTRISNFYGNPGGVAQATEVDGQIHFSLAPPRLLREPTAEELASPTFKLAGLYGDRAVGLWKKLSTGRATCACGGELVLTGKTYVCSKEGCARRFPIEQVRGSRNFSFYTNDSLGSDPGVDHERVNGRNPVAKGLKKALVHLMRMDSPHADMRLPAQAMFQLGTPLDLDALTAEANPAELYDSWLKSRNLTFTRSPISGMITGVDNGRSEIAITIKGEREVRVKLPPGMVPLVAEGDHRAAGEPLADIMLPGAPPARFLQLSPEMQTGIVPMLVRGHILQQESGQSVVYSRHEPVDGVPTYGYAALGAHAEGSRPYVDLQPFQLDVPRLHEVGVNAPDCAGVVRLNPSALQGETFDLYGEDYRKFIAQAAAWRREARRLQGKEPRRRPFDAGRRAARQAPRPTSVIEAAPAAPLSAPIGELAASAFKAFEAEKA